MAYPQRASAANRRVLPRSILFAAAPLLGMAGLAHAQSSVTVYGIIDSGVEYVTNVGASGDSIWRVPSLTGTLPSRLGFRGSEDLGNGLKANFLMEQGFAPDQGTLNQGGRAWGRQLYVGLSSTSWGSISFGRQYSHIFYSMIGDTIGPNIYSIGQLDGYLANARMDNSISYRGTFGGFTLGASYSLGRDTAGSLPAGGCAGESSTDKSACRGMSGSLQYATPDWGVALAYERQNGGAGAGSPLPLSSQTDTRTLLNGFVKFGSTKVGAIFLRRDNEGSATPKSDIYSLGVTHPIGPVVLDASYSTLRVKNSSDEASIFAARALYNLSKRTAVYTTVGHLTNKGNATYTVDGGVVAGSAPAPGVNQTGVMVGVRHIF